MHAHYICIFCRIEGIEQILEATDSDLLHHVSPFERLQNNDDLPVNAKMGTILKVQDMDVSALSNIHIKKNIPTFLIARFPELENAHLQKILVED